MKTFLATVIMTTAFLLNSCGGVGPVVHAGTPDCTPEFFFDIPQNQQQASGGDVIEGPHTLWMATPACTITVPITMSHVTQFAHKVQILTVQMGSNTGSIFEWDQVLTITDPSGAVLISQQQQYDKHADLSGNRQGALFLYFANPRTGW